MPLGVPALLTLGITGFRHSGPYPLLGRKLPSKHYVVWSANRNISSAVWVVYSWVISHNYKVSFYIYSLYWSVLVKMFWCITYYTSIDLHLLPCNCMILLFLCIYFFSVSVFYWHFTYSLRRERLCAAAALRAFQFTVIQKLYKLLYAYTWAYTVIICIYMTHFFSSATWPVSTKDKTEIGRLINRKTIDWIQLKYH